VLGGGGADEFVVGYVEGGEESLEDEGGVVDEFLGGGVVVSCRFFYFLTMLIRPTHKKHFPPTKTHKPRNHITRNRCIRVTNVWFIIHVINRCGDLKWRCSIVYSGWGCFCCCCGGR